MKLAFILLLFLILISCNQNKKEKENQNEDLSGLVIDDTPDTNYIKRRDSVLLSLSIDIIIAIQQKDYSKIASFASPDAGIRFSPYGFIDLSLSQVLTAPQILEYSGNNKQLVWGLYDGSGDTIRLTIAGFIDKFLNNKDYSLAPQKSVNRMLGQGNSFNNLKEVFPGSDFTEFYFPGFDPKYEGMDWQTLRLVFTTENGRYVLVGIVHDQWTI